jgi:hypothetical protein
MAVDVRAPARAGASEGAKEAMGGDQGRLDRGWSAAFLGALALIQLTWVGVLLYVAYRLLVAIGLF